MNADTTKTARLARINVDGLRVEDDWTTGTTFDYIEIAVGGEVVDTVVVESSEDQAPYDEALQEAGHGDATWID